MLSLIDSPELILIAVGIISVPQGAGAGRGDIRGFEEIQRQRGGNFGEASSRTASFIRFAGRTSDGHHAISWQILVRAQMLA